MSLDDPDDSDNPRNKKKASSSNLKAHVIQQMGQIGINSVDTVNSYEELGWYDPDLESKQATAKTLNWLKQIKFEEFMYPDHLMKYGVVPKCCFVPSKELLKKMIRTVTRCKNL